MRSRDEKSLAHVPSFSPSWAMLALISIDPVTPTGPPVWESLLLRKFEPKLTVSLNQAISNLAS